MLAGVIRTAPRAMTWHTDTGRNADANAPALRVTVSGITEQQTIIRAVSANSSHRPDAGSGGKVTRAQHERGQPSAENAVTLLARVPRSVVCRELAAPVPASQCPRTGLAPRGRSVVDIGGIKNRTIAIAFTADR